MNLEIPFPIDRCVQCGVHYLEYTCPPHLQLVQSACQYVLAGKMETIEDIFHLVSVGILFKDVCKVGCFSQLVALAQHHTLV